MGRVEAFLVLGLFAGLIHVGSGIKCIVCNSAYDKECESGSADVLKKNFEVDCNQLINGKNAYLVKVFGENLVKWNRTLLNAVMRWNNTAPAAVVANCSCPERLENKTLPDPKTNMSVPVCETKVFKVPAPKGPLVTKEDGWLGKSWKTIPENRPEYDPCLFHPPRPLISPRLFRMSIKPRKTYRVSEYDACRKLVMKPAETVFPHTTKESETRVVRTCSFVQSKSNKKERPDADIVDKSCKDYKTKSIITNCLCKGDNCNGSPKGPNGFSSRVIMFVTSLPVLFYLLHK